MQHQMLIKYSQDLNHVFTFITLGQVLIFSVLICLVGYEIFIVSKKKVFIKYRIRTLNYRPFFQDNYLSEICMLDGLRLNWNFYRLLKADAAPTRRAVFIFYITGTMTQLMMFTYSCNILAEESMNVAEAAYSSSWTSMPINEISKFLRRGLLMIIIRARKPCALSAGGFFSVSLETYTAVKFILSNVGN